MSGLRRWRTIGVLTCSQRCSLRQVTSTYYDLLPTMNHLKELLRSQLLHNMESDANVVDVSRTEETLAGSLMDKFSDPTDPIRARFQHLHQPANMHYEARTHTVLIADTGPRFYADNATPTYPTDASARAQIACFL
eukprot:4067915-Pleurochrysis_carterae.AAC.1